MWVNKMFKRSFIRCKGFFFVDTDVVASFQNNELNVKKFVRDPKNHFFYTETVKNELQKSGGKVNNKFEFFESRLSQGGKLKALYRLNTLWKERFNGRKHQIRDGFGLPPRMLMEFQNDLFIVFEASNSAFDVRLPGIENFEAPVFLTNNMKLVNKFMLRPEAVEVLETTINSSGFEHLIAIANLDDAIAEWAKNK